MKKMADADRLGSRSPRLAEGEETPGTRPKGKSTSPKGADFPKSPGNETPKRKTLPSPTRGSTAKSLAAVDKSGQRSPKQTGSPKRTSPPNLPEGAAAVPQIAVPAGPGAAAPTRGAWKWLDMVRKHVGTPSLGGTPTPGASPKVPGSPKLAGTPAHRDSVSAEQPPKRGGGLSARVAKPSSPDPEASRRKPESSKTPPASPKPGSPRAKVQGRQSPGSRSPTSGSMSPTPGSKSSTPGSVSPTPGKQSPMSPQQQRRPTISMKDPRLRHFWRSMRSHLRREKEVASPGEESPNVGAVKRSPRLSMVDAAAAAAGFPTRKRLQPNAGKRRSRIVVTGDSFAQASQSTAAYSCANFCLERLHCSW
ncbi:hypothetical protein MTO96_046297 [Rhipicephalus appendiculatus]